MRSARERCQQVDERLGRPGWLHLERARALSLSIHVGVIAPKNP
jgi:hypothetical protein